MYPVIIRPFGELSVSEYHRIVEARETVFYLEQRITVADADSVDPQSIFLWMEDQGRIIAFLRIIPAGIVYKEASIGRVLVDAAYRRRGLCRHLMLEALDHLTKAQGTKPIRISAQKYLIQFYTSLDFEVVSEEYLEAGIPHVKMLRT